MPRPKGRPKKKPCVDVSQASSSSGGYGELAMGPPTGDLLPGDPSPPSGHNLRPRRGRAAQAKVNGFRVEKDDLARFT